MSAPVTIVRFTDPDEFLAELAAEAEHVTDGIVRCTKQFQQSPKYAPLQYVSVLAGFRVRDTIVRLEHYVGQIVGHPIDRDDHATLGQADKVQDRIKAACAERGLELRAGSFRAPTERES